MRIKKFQEIVDKLRNKKQKNNYDIHKIYGKIYYPLYNLDAPIYSRDYDIYDETGRKLDVIFLRDINYAHSSRKMSKYFIWDKYDFTLDTHCYNGMQMAETMGKPQKRYGFFPESEAIAPYQYKVFEKYKGIEKDFDLIFTFSADLLSKLNNAVFIPFCASPWADDESVKASGGGEFYLAKNKKCFNFVF